MNTFQLSQIDYGTDSGDWCSTLRAIRDAVAHRVAYFSEAYGILPFDLKLRAFLHLPRFRSEELDNNDLISDEIERLAKRTHELQQGFKEWTNQAPLGSLERNNTQVSEIAEDIATLIHERFHYIGSGRAGRHFAAYFGGRRLPGAIATISEMDVKKIRTHLPVTQDGPCLLLSRMFSFPWAPKNTISYLLGRLVRLLKNEGQVESLVTWVNPNLEFDASSYRAANWRYLASEPVVYRYRNGNYLTARQIFQTTQDTSLNLDTSKIRLAPLQIWRYRIVK